MITADGIKSTNDPIGVGGLSNAPGYDQSGVSNGVTYRLRVWYSESSAMAQVDVSGQASAVISIALPSLPKPPNLSGGSTQSLFLNLIEYSVGADVQADNIAGYLILSKAGTVRLFIRADAAFMTGSSETRVFRL